MTDEVTIRLQRVTVAWLSLSLCIAGYVLFFILRHISPSNIQPYRVRVGIAMVIMAFISNSLQTIYHMVPEADSEVNALWFCVDFLDFTSAAATFSLYILIGWWRFTSVPLLKTNKGIIMSILRSPWLIVFTTLSCFTGALLCLFSIYFEEDLCPFADTGDCQLWRRICLLMEHGILILGDILFTITYVTTWPQYALLIKRPNSRPDFKSILVLVGLFVSLCILLIIVLDGFLSSDIWIASRLLAVSHKTMLICLVSGYLLQMKHIAEYENNPTITVSNPTGDPKQLEAMDIIQDIAYVGPTVVVTNQSNSTNKPSLSRQQQQDISTAVVASSLGEVPVDQSVERTLILSESSIALSSSGGISGISRAP